jgi:hypothetical protein
MSQERKKYRLGNQPEEYDLEENYLGWTPQEGNWEKIYAQGHNTNSAEVISIFSKNKEFVTLFFHDFIIKDAFPLSFFAEKRSSNWTHFAIVSRNKTSEKFIIPLH